MTDRRLVTHVTNTLAGHGTALVSVCTAQPDCLDAALMLARDRGRDILIEATSNQVNQYGGYTGLTPAAFIADMRARITRLGVDPSSVFFGGDHLGPQAWKHLPAEDAMSKAHQMLREYVEAGFTKIHLDCSEGCAGEPAVLDDHTVATRAAKLAQTCEAHAPNPEALVYVIGTEVPPPGGARTGHDSVTPTAPNSVRQTLAIHKAAFSPKTWARVVGVVVQPGLEFGAATLDRFPMDGPDELSPVLADWPGIAFEAHSTDYQDPEVFPELARRRFAFLKVGPALTFAYREAIYALDAIRGWYDAAASPLPTVMQGLIDANPDTWAAHFKADGAALGHLQHFSYSDRIRYLWPHAEAQAAVNDLLDALENLTPMDPLLLQYLSRDIVDAITQSRQSWPRAVITAKVQTALSPYLF